LTEGAPLPNRRAAVLVLIALVTGAVLAMLAQPHLSHVDFVSFAGRAQRLRVGQDLVHPLYPIGYPALLSAFQAVTGDVLLAGKVLAALSGASAIAAVGALLGPLPALWVLGQGALLQWGSTEGTDMPAAALALAALAAANGRRPVLAGALVGASCMFRYTGIAALPVVLLLAGQPHKVLLALAAGTAPHWVLVLATGAPLLPNQAENLAIAAGRPTDLLSLDTVRRWPSGFLRAAWTTVWHPPTWVGAIGLAVGMIRRDRRAWGLAGFALAHIALIGLAFANPRLCLPATLCVAAGAAFLIPNKWPRAAWLLPLGALPVAIGAAGALTTQTDAEIRRSDIAAAMSAHPGPFLTSDPWVTVRAAGWLHGGIPMREVGESRAVTPSLVVRHGKKSGVGTVVVDNTRVRASYPGLAPLLTDEQADGLTLAGEGHGWRIWQVKGVETPTHR
jgi:hypothetical protein